MKSILFLAIISGLICQTAFAGKTILKSSECAFVLNMADEEVRQNLTEFVNTPTLEGLQELLTKVLPNGRLSSQSSNGEPAVLQFESSKQPSGQWAHISIYNPKTLHDSILGGGFYKKETVFNIVATTTEFKNKQISAPYVAKYEHNIITSVDFSDNTLKILLTRDEEGQDFDRGKKYQELKIAFNDKGRPTTLTVRNGSSLMTSLIWDKMDIDIPANADIAKLVYGDDQHPTYHW